MIKKVDLQSYAMQRMKEKGRGSRPGPVVTISRMFGCPSKLVANLLVTELNKSRKNKWSWVSKEILHESAHELGLPPSELKYFFQYHEQGVFDGMLTTLAKFYVSDRKIYQAIQKVIYTTGYKGNVVIVGRGGAAICRDIPNSLHIRLYAPAEWRIARVMESHNISHNQAARLIGDYDEKRKKFMNFYAKKLPFESLFDVIFNCSSFEKDQIVYAILSMMKSKKMVGN